MHGRVVWALRARARATRARVIRARACVRMRMCKEKGQTPYAIFSNEDGLLSGFEGL